jgi:hypothetical protein
VQKIKSFFSQPHHYLRIFFYLIVALAFVSAGFIIFYQYKLIREAREAADVGYKEALFESHLVEMEKQNLEEALGALEQQYAKLIEEGEGSVLLEIEETYGLYQDFSAKLERNGGADIDTQSSANKLSRWGILILNQDFETLKNEINGEVTVLDSAYDEYLASLPPPPPPEPSPPPAQPQPVQTSAEGYSIVSVSTERGTFNVNLIKVPLSSYKVKTVSANTDNCKDNCPTKSLADYVKESNAYAGMHGTYFCPPDYSTCSGKVNSYDFAFYNSDRKKWLNSGALTWGKTGLMTFNGNTPAFYRETSSYGGSGVTAGISNYPSLVSNSNIVVKSEDLTTFQIDMKGPRGAIGYDDKNLYLAIVSNATVIDTAYVMKALGARNALNLDGGGSSAMYIGGGYVVGPGRSLPNAVVIVR